MSQSLTQQLAAFLKARPHQWIGAREFEQFGRQSWRTRLSECRKAPHFMTIENRVTIREWKGTLPMGQSRHWKQSEYRYVPLQAVTAADDQKGHVFKAAQDYVDRQIKTMQEHGGAPKLSATAKKEIIQMVANATK